MDFKKLTQLEVEELLLQSDNHIELIGVFLEDIDLSNVTLNKCLLKNCCIKNSNFYGVRSLDFQIMESYIENTNFSNCSLGKPLCSYEEPEHNVKFIQTRIIGSCFLRADLTAVELKECFIEDTDFKGSIFSGVVFVENTVLRSDFSCIKMAGEQPVFKLSDFDACRLNYVYTMYGLVLDSLVFKNCQLEWIRIGRYGKDSSMDQLSFENCILTFGSCFGTMNKVEHLNLKNCVFMDFEQCLNTEKV